MDSDLKFLKFSDSDFGFITWLERAAKGGEKLAVNNRQCCLNFGSEVAAQELMTFFFFFFFFFGGQRLVDGKMAKIAVQVCRNSVCGIECKFAVPSTSYYDIKSKYRNF